MINKIENNDRIYNNINKYIEGEIEFEDLNIELHSEDLYKEKFK